MDKILFGDLVESMQQHNEIIAGTRKAARATKVDAQSTKVLRASLLRTYVVLRLPTSWAGGRLPALSHSGTGFHCQDHTISNSPHV